MQHRQYGPVPWEVSIVSQHEEKKKSVTVIYHWKIIKKSNSCIVAIHEGEEMMIEEIFLILGNKWMPMTVELQTDMNREDPQQNFLVRILKVHGNEFFNILEKHTK